MAIKTVIWEKVLLNLLTISTNEINDALVGMQISNQQAIDQKMIDMDGTETKSRLGANSILAVSLACAHANANNNQQSLFRSFDFSKTYQLPVPMMNIINGGESMPTIVLISKSL